MYTTRLVNEVWTRDLCAGCAMCVAACSKQVLYWGAGEHPHLRKIHKSIGLSKFELDTCSVCEHYCEVACPRLEAAARMSALEQVSVRASGTLGGGEPNDVVRNLLIAARANGLIDGALLIDADRGGRTRARVVTGAGEIAESVGFQYIWTPVLDALNQAVFDLGLKNIAIVSAPCTAQAVRRLTDSDVPRLEAYRKAIRLNVALFCTGVFQPDAFLEMLSTGANLAPENIQRITAYPREGKMRALLWDGTTYEMDLTNAEAYTRAGCARCDDYLGESADIAVGSAGSSQGFSTLIVRTLTGRAVAQNAITMNMIEKVQEADKEALARASVEKDRRERAKAFDELQVLMLDALRDPRKRAQVKVQFDLLYGRPSSIKEDYRYAGCGDCSGC
ncbi:MAG: Coenzyme F420 hydrogenase/dehydrogenase, beta subunit C-terminal domain [Chloroflexi bacterium]|nr:Coenzyme F420 hydrogenase/dehydrogenase, beta subunit C-terminal domain [Chloroflexota bacterium]